MENFTEFDKSVNALALCTLTHSLLAYSINLTQLLTSLAATLACLVMSDGHAVIGS
jgi:hypothetical protein